MGQGSVESHKRKENEWWGVLRNEVEWKTSRIVSDETEIKWNKIKYYWIIQVVKDLETEIEVETVRENQEKLKNKYEDVWPWRLFLFLSITNQLILSFIHLFLSNKISEICC